MRTNNDLFLPLLLLTKTNLKTDLFVISKSKEDSQYKVKFRYTYPPDKYFVNDLCIRRFNVLLGIKMLKINHFH